MATGTLIDPRAVVDPEARLGADVRIGPFCVIGPGITIGDRCRLLSHVVIERWTELGADNTIFPMASIGAAPQDLKYDGEETRLVVGSRNTIREFVTLNRGTEGGGGLTEIGDDNLLMASSHVAHDCRIGSRIVFGNAVTLGGHVEVGDDAKIEAFSGVHQFCRVARHAYVGGYSVLTQDALPWVMTVGNRAKSYGLNTIGLKRKGYSRETIAALKKCYMMLFRSKLVLAEALDKVAAELGQIPEVRYFVEFVRSSERGVCR